MIFFAKKIQVINRANHWSGIMGTYYTGALFRKMGVQHAAAPFFPNYSLSDNLLLFQNHTLQKCWPFSPVEIRNQMSQNNNIKCFNPFLTSKNEVE